MATNCLVTIRALSCVRHATRNLSDSGDITTYFSGANIRSEHIDSTFFLVLFKIFADKGNVEVCLHYLTLVP